MLNGPSPNITTNTIDIYARATAYSGDGDLDGNAGYPSIGTPSFSTVPCSVQLYNADLADPSLKANVIFFGSVLFNVDDFPAGYTPRYRDKYLWIDGLGTTHTLFTTLPIDQAGGGKAFEVPVIEYTRG
jgi:hypothetical protein